MLARANRVTRPADFRAAVRRGRRNGTRSLVVHVIDTSAVDPVRFGFIVTKAVGNAVTRNRVRRRLREASRDILPTLPDGHDVVVRALPGSGQVPWASLHADLTESVGRAVKG